MRKIISLVVTFTFFHSQLLYALPVKNNASQGVKFNQNQNTLNITAPDRSVINYDSFDIAAAERVNFIQPSASAGVLNRVLSGGASSINGALSANGNVLLVNPSGVLFGGGAKVNANSFIASTKDISDANFKAGLLKFEGSTNGKIVNAGLINANTNVGLIAANIENKGSIKAGKNVGLIAGNKGSISVDFEGDGLVNFNADSSSIGSGEITNSGTIKAGQVLLTANDVSDVLKNVINNTGTIEATKAVAGENGSIMLISDASVKNTGTLKAPEGEIVLKTGGDMKSEGTISAVDGDVDIEATGDVTSSGTLEAGTLTERGATFGISGEFSVGESTLKNDDDAIEFTGDTTLTGNISDVDNIIIGGGVTLTLAADVTLTAGADTNANTAVNDSSNILPGGGSGAIDFIWMADDAVIDGAGFDLTFDTKGTNSFLTSIIGVDDLTFLNGNTDKVSDTVTYELKKDITTTGAFTIGEGVTMHLYPINNLGNLVSDITLTADSFAVGGTGANAGSIRLNNRNLTLDATSTTVDSNVNVYITDQTYDNAYSFGSLKFLGNENTKFNLGVSNYDDYDNMIQVHGIDMGSAAGRVANIELADTLGHFTATGGTTFADFNMYGSSTLKANANTRVYGRTFFMDNDAVMDANGYNFDLTATDATNHSVVTNIIGANDLAFFKGGTEPQTNFDLQKDITATGTFTIGEGAIMALYPIDAVGTPISDIKLTADNFSAGGAGDNAGSFKLVDKGLTFDATSAITDSTVNFYVTDTAGSAITSSGKLQFLGHKDTKFDVGVSNYATAGLPSMHIRVNGFELGDDSGRVANLEVKDTIREFAAAHVPGGDFVMNGSSSIDWLGTGPLRIYGDAILMDYGSSITATGNTLGIYSYHDAGTSYLGDVSAGYLSLYGPDEFYLRGDVTSSSTFYSSKLLHLDADSSTILLTADRFSLQAGIELNNHNLILNATSETLDSYVNFYVNDQTYDNVYSFGFLRFWGNENTKFDVGLVNNDTNVDNMIQVHGINMGSLSRVANISLADTISHFAATGGTEFNDFNMYGSSTLTANTDTRVYARNILMDDSSVMDANGYNLDLVSTNDRGPSVITNIVDVNDLSFFKGGIAAQMHYDIERNITAAGTMTVGDGVVLDVERIDLRLTADNFAAGGIGANAGSIKQQYFGLTLDATSTTEDSNINFFVNDMFNDTAYYTGALTLLGNSATKFNIGLANNDANSGNKIMLKGIDLGNSVGRVANVELADTIGELSAGADVGGDFTMHGNSGLMFATDDNPYASKTVTGKTIQMDEDSVIDANGSDLRFYNTGAGSSTISNVNNAAGLGFYSGLQSTYNLLKDIAISDTFVISENTSLTLDSPVNEIALTASEFRYDGYGNYSGYVNLNNNSLTLDATSNLYSSINFDASDAVNGTLSTSGDLKLLGDPSSQFNIYFINAPSNLSVDMGNITLGDDTGRSANCSFSGVSELSTGVLSLHNDSDFKVTEDITINGNIQMDNESRICLSSDSLTLAGTGTSTLSTILSASNLLLQSGDYNLTKDLSVSNYLWLGSGVKLTLDPKDSAGLDASDIALSAYTFRTNTSGEYDLNNKNVTFTATNAAEHHGLNFYSNQPDGSAFSTGSLSFLRAGGVSPTFALNVGNQSGNRGNKLSVNGFNIGDGVKVDLGYDLSELSSSTVSGDLNMVDDSMLIAHTDLNLSFNEISMKNSTAVINANNHDLTLSISGGSSYSGSLIGTLNGTKNLNFLAYPGSTHVFYTLEDTEYSADIFRVGEGVVLTVAPHMLYEDMLFSASNFLFEGTGFNAGSVDLERDNLILDSSSTTVDSIVNFYMKDGWFTPEGVTFLGNDTTKYLVGGANNATPDNHILQVDYFSLGDDSGRIANVELLSTVGELEALTYQRPSLLIHGDSSLTLNADTKISARTIVMDATSTIDANSNNITLYSEGDSTLGSFTNLLDFTLVDAIEDGSQIQYNLLGDTINARNVNLGADVKLRGANAVTTINAENLSMFGNSQLTAWDASGNHNDIVLNISNAATLGELFFVGDLTLTGGATFNEISWQDTWNLDGNFTLGENTTLTSDSNLIINALDAIVMNIGSSIIMNNNSNLTLKALNASTLYDLNAGTGDITLEGTGATPTSYSENGTITCSNNNTPTYINAN